MMKAIQEYNEMIMKPSWKWLKKHWKGYFVFLAITVAVECVWLYWRDINNYIKNKFVKSEDES